MKSAKEIHTSIMGHEIDDSIKVQTFLKPFGKVLVFDANWYLPLNIPELQRISVMLISYTILLALPFLGEIYDETLWYVGTILLIPVTVCKFVWYEKYEEKFYCRWHKDREQGFKINVAREGVKGFALMILTVIIGQYFGRGLTPLDIVYKLPSGVLVGLFLLLMAFGSAIGVVAWYEKEKKYYRIYFEREEQQEI